MKSAREAITEAYKALEEAFYRGDADALAQIYTDDAEWLVPDAPPIKGRVAISQAWKNALGDGGNRVHVEVREVNESGDWAYEVGAFTTTAPDGKVLSVGKYIVIWKRHANGDWKTHRDVFNWDVPPGR